MPGLLDGLMGEPCPDIVREVSAQGFFLLGKGLKEENIHGQSVPIFFEYDNRRVEPSFIQVLSGERRNISRVVIKDP